MICRSAKQRVPRRSNVSWPSDVAIAIVPNNTTGSGNTLARGNTLQKHEPSVLIDGVQSSLHSCHVAIVADVSPDAIHTSQNDEAMQESQSIDIALDECRLQVP